MPLRQPNNVQQLTPALMAAFTRTISPERWRTYEIASGFNDDLTHRLYMWNAAIGQSFHFPLQSVEVALRNVIHASISAVYGPNWATEQAFRAAMQPHQLNYITKAAQRYYRMNRRNPTTSQTVASLSLGFWVAILRRHYNPLIWATQENIAFPSLANGETIGNVSSTATTIQGLRNRIFHQEPLIGHNLSLEYGAILRMLGWICPETRDWVRAHSSVPTVIRERPR